MSKDLPYWLQNLIICGREEGDDPFERDENGEVVEEDGKQVLKEGWEEGPDGKPVKSDDSDDEDDDDDEDDVDYKEKAAKLAESLRRERKLRREAQRDARKNAKKKPDSSKPDESSEVTRELEEQRQKTARLAEGLKNDRVDRAILEAARDAGFIDPTDALVDKIRKEVDVEQDDDDPTDIDIDMDSVTDAVAEYAAKKKHLVGTPPPEEPSGTRFRKKGDKSKKTTDAQALRSVYPSLN